MAQHHGAEEQAVSADAVRAELGRMLESPHFDASERNRGFLTYVVEEALAGRTDRIKAYTIATEVFGRDPKFDPQLDSIVRIEAGRLRRSLERYYLTDGRTSRLRIDIPRGGYVPVFGSAEPAVLSQRPGRLAPGAGHRLRGGGRPVVLPDLHPRLHAVADHRAHPLHRAARLRRGGRRCAIRPTSIPRPPGADLAADYVVTGQTSLLPDRFEVDVLLVEAATGRAVWAETFERASAAVRDHRAPQRGGEPGRAGAGAALRRDPERPGARRRRTGRPRCSAATRRSCCSTPTGGPSTAR